MKFLVLVILVASSSQIRAQSDMCKGAEKVFDFEMLIGQYRFINNATANFAPEQLKLVADVLKQESTLTHIDSANPRPAMFGWNPYCMDNLIDMNNFFSRSVYLFLTKDYEGAKKAMDMAAAKGDCFKKSVDSYFGKQPYVEPTTGAPQPTTPKGDGGRNSGGLTKLSGSLLIALTWMGIAVSSLY